MQRDSALLEGNFYHIYNRGANKADVFLNESDFRRFQILLFLGNSKEKVPIRDTVKKYKSQGRSLRFIFEEEKPDRELVDVLGYALMTNHFHLILRQKAENGISEFMKKVGTAYSMYFNTLYDHSGTVFQGRFKSKYVGEGEYLRWLFAYVALNPLDIAYPARKEFGVPDKEVAEKFLASYAHASYPDMRMRESARRPEAKIISFDALKEFGDDVPDFSDISSLLRIESEPPELA